MLSKRFPADTLFFIMEEDMQFWDVQADRESVRVAGAEPSAAPAPSPPQAASGSRVPEPSAGIQEKFLGGRLVDDLVKIMTKAHRLGSGDFCWYSFVPDKAETKADWSYPKFGFGSAGIMLTKRAAKQIADTFNNDKWKPNHIDMELKRWAQQELPERLRACWLWPPVGNFSSHQSECCPKQVGFRQSLWSKPWCTPGTRPSDDPNQTSKRLYEFVAKGWQNTIGSIANAEFEDDSLVWQTFWGDPEIPPADTERQKRELRRQLRVDWLRHYCDAEAQASLKRRLSCSMLSGKHCVYRNTKQKHISIID